VSRAKFAVDGTVAWENYYGDTGPVDPDWGMGACAVADTEMAVAGYRAVEGRDPGDLCFLRTDLDGVQSGYRRFVDSFYEYGCAICRTPDLGYLICGASKNDTTMTNDLLLAKKLDGSGWVWADTLGGAGSDWGSSLDQPVPGFYIISGQTSSYGSGGFDGWLLYMREPAAGVPDMGNSQMGVLKPVTTPNPFRGTTTIRCDLPRPAAFRLAIYDIAGRMVALLADGREEAGRCSRTWDGRNQTGRKLSPGVYLARITAGDASSTRKLVLLK
jgi:hypothetical protein